MLHSNHTTAEVQLHSIIIIIILNTEADNKCRLCQRFDETIDHTISASQILAKEQYIKRHDSVCAQTTTLQHMQGNKGTIGQKTLILTCAKIGRNKSRRQGNHIVEPTNTN